MDSIDWDSLAEEALNKTDKQFSQQLANLTSLKANEIDTFITQSKISNTNALKVLQEINNSTNDNTQKANAIKNIDNGVEFLIKLVSKIL